MARDTSFYYAFLVLPPERRRAIVAVWDFCRAVDDAVDEAVPAGEASSHDPHHGPAADLRRWRAELARCFEGGTPTTEQGRALQRVLQRFALTRQPFEDVIDGVSMDLGHPRYQTFDELSEYCRRVASAVGLICVEVFGCRTLLAREYAMNLGMALQLTNIVRDVATDFERGRVYLPQEDLLRFGVREEDLARRRITPSIRVLLAFECARARDYFDRAARALAPADAHRLVAAEIMAAIYRKLLDRIERAGYDVFSQTIRISRPHRAWIALTTFGRVMWAGRPRREPENRKAQAGAAGRRR